MFVAGQILGMCTKKTKVAIQSNFPAETNDPWSPSFAIAV